MLVFVVALVVAFVAAIVMASRSSGPVAFRYATTLGSWRLKVVSVNWNGGSAPPGAREVDVAMRVTYRGAGYARPPFVFYVEGNHNVPYASCDPQVGIETISDTLYSGGSETSTLCFDAARNDLSTLTLHVAPLRLAQGSNGGSTAFALRSS